MFSGHSVSLFKEATHLFADFSKLKPDDARVNVAEAAAQGVNCLKPEYIADYLIQVCTPTEGLGNALRPPNRRMGQPQPPEASGRDCCCAGRVPPLPAIVAASAWCWVFRSVASHFNCYNMTCSSAGSGICGRVGSLQNIQNIGVQCSFCYFEF